MNAKRILGNLVRKLVRKTANTNIGHHIIMNEALHQLSDQSRYSGKKWQITDEFFSVSRRHLAGNEYWIPGPTRTINLARKYFKQLENHSLDRSKPFLDLGCGPRTPYGICMIFHLNGWNECWALDIEPYDSKRASEALADLLKDALANPNDYSFLANSDEIVNSARKFNIAALENGHLEEGLNGIDFHHVVTDIVEFQNRDEIPKFGTVCSHTVLEHLMDLQRAFESMKNISSDGAIHYHYIDFVDHRAYNSPEKYDWWSFLEVPRTVSDPISNKVRCSDMKLQIADASFEIITWIPELSECPFNIRNRIHESWNTISDEDLQSLRVNVVMKA